MPIHRVSQLELLVLSALQGREEYGLAIVESIQTATGRSLSLGGLYTTLHRMERKGLVTSRWGESTEVRQGARRRYYKMTALGEHALTTTKETLERAWNLKPGLGSMGAS
jgi:DNA-binding PadR family transcriptional regulator